MRKIFYFLFLMTISVNSLNAQQRVTNSEEPIEEAQLTEAEELKQKGKSSNFSSELYTGFVESGNTLSMAYNIFGFVLDATYGTIYENNDYDMWSIGLAYNYRYFITDGIYVDARAGVQYQSFVYDPVGGDKITNGGVGLMATPILGVRIINRGFFAGTHIIAGYRYNMHKFDPDVAFDYLTLGIAFSF